MCCIFLLLQRRISAADEVKPPWTQIVLCPCQCFCGCEFFCEFPLEPLEFVLSYLLLFLFVFVYLLRTEDDIFGKASHFSRLFSVELSTSNSLRVPGPLSHALLSCSGRRKSLLWTEMLCLLRMLISLHCLRREPRFICLRYRHLHQIINAYIMQHMLVVVFLVSI